MRLLLVGNYGVGNLGDEALRDYFLSAFPEMDWQVVSAHPTSREFPRLPFGPRSFLRTPWWRTVIALWKSDGMVLGGGTLFTDSESMLACFLWGWHVFVAWIFQRPVLLAFQGIGPFRSKIAERITRFAVRHAVFVSVRDDDSFARISGWSGRRPIVRTFDPVFSMIHASRTSSDGHCLLLIPREHSEHVFLERSIALSSKQSWQSIRILSLKPDDVCEQRFIASLQKAVPSATTLIIRTLSQLEEALASSSFIFTQRYHGALVALALRVPFDVCSSVPGDKLAGIVSLIGKENDCAALVNHGQESLRSAFAELDS